MFIISFLANAGNKIKADLPPPVRVIQKTSTPLTMQQESNSWK
jgi:hypothetical protein